MLLEQAAKLQITPSDLARSILYAGLFNPTPPTPPLGRALYARLTVIPPKDDDA